MTQEQRWFEVSVDTAGRFLPHPQHQIVFHGVNKSGSLVLSDVMREAYNQHGRGREFFSQYHKSPRKLDELLAKLGSGAPGFYVAHYLYGRFEVGGRRLLFTQFRHPLPRIVSCYQWHLNRYEDRGGNRREYPSFQEYLERGRGRRDSQVEQFGIGWGFDDDDERARFAASLSIQEIGARARVALERDAHLIGIAEYSEETIFLLAHLCGLDRVPAWQRDLRNRGRPLVSELDEATIALIEELYVEDFRLYSWAKGRFFAQLEGVEFGPGLAAYKDACVAEYKDRLI